MIQEGAAALIVAQVPVLGNYGWGSGDAPFAVFRTEGPGHDRCGRTFVAERLCSDRHSKPMVSR
jgi:hypothetical protein